MFGRRNPDPQPPRDTRSIEHDLDLDVLAGLPEEPPAPSAPDQASLDRPAELIDEPAPESAAGSPTPTLPTTNHVASAPRPRAPVESVIGPDDFFDGRYRSERGVRIQGTARGSIESHQYIFVEASAQVEADLSAEDITIAGSFSGKIECRHRLEITSSGRVKGQVQTELLVVQEGGIIDGELHMPAAGGNTAAPTAPTTPKL